MSVFDNQPKQSRSNNVEGWERLLSISSGIAMARGGLKRGGVIGLARAAFGGLLLARGIAGHCRLKGIVEDARAMRPDVDRISDTVSRLEHQVAERLKVTDKRN